MRMQEMVRKDADAVAVVVMLLAVDPDCRNRCTHLSLLWALN
jgi:hypothetical protein